MFDVLLFYCFVTLLSCRFVVLLFCYFVGLLFCWLVVLLDCGVFVLLLCCGYSFTAFVVEAVNSPDHVQGSNVERCLLRRWINGVKGVQGIISGLSDVLP